MPRGHPIIDKKKLPIRRANIVFTRKNFKWKSLSKHFDDIIEMFVKNTGLKLGKTDDAEKQYMAYLKAINRMDLEANRKPQGVIGKEDYLAHRIVFPDTDDYRMCLYALDKFANPMTLTFATGNISRFLYDNNIKHKVYYDDLLFKVNRAIKKCHA